jgi:hypothetical protein
MRLYQALSQFGKKVHSVYGTEGGWASFSGLMYWQARDAIKALKQEIESLKSDGSDN